MKITQLEPFILHVPVTHSRIADSTHHVTHWWQVADLALAHRLPVEAHVSDMVQIHQHLAIAHPASDLLEYIPWLRACFEEPATVEDGHFRIPEIPGAATTLGADAVERFAVT